MIEPLQSHFRLTPEDSFPAPKWYSQQMAWVQNPENPENSAYNCPVALRIHGPLDPRALERSIQEIVRRHQPLRSVFSIVEDRLIQIVLPSQPLPLPVVDVRNVCEAEREAEALRLVIEDANRPFDLSRGPLLRAKLWCVKPEDHVLLLTTHHIVSDSFSMTILLRELSLVYEAFSAGRPSPLPEISFQYGDFVRQQQKRFEHKESEYIAFWNQQLASGEGFHHLHADRIRSKSHTYRGTHERIILDQALTNSLTTLSQKEKVTPFMALLAALQCLVRRYSGQQDIGVASCVANRQSLQVENLVGHFSNHVVFRTNLANNPTHREVLRRVRKIALTAYSYQDLPFGGVTEKLETTSGTGRNDLFQVLLVLTDNPKEEWSFSGMDVTLLPLDVGKTAYDLIVWLKMMEEKLEIDAQYNSDLFEAATIRQILTDYRSVLDAMSTNVEARVSELKIASLQTESHNHPRIEHLTQDYKAPQDAIESQLIKLWETLLDKRPIGVNDDFFELGGNSLLATRLFAQLEETFKLRIPLSILIQAPTIETLAKVIRQPALCNTWRSLLAIQPNGARPPLFCAHGESGSLLMYRGLAQYLGPDQPVYGLQPQGLDGKEPPLTTIEEMAANYVKEIQSIQAEGPYFLAGYCMGGTVAFEMAQQFRRQGQCVGLLALLDTYNWRNVKRTFLRDLYFNAQTCWFGWKHFLLTDSGDKVRSVQAGCDEYRNTSGIAECNRQAALSYIPKVYPGRILQIRPARQYARYNGPELGWDEFAADGLEIFSLPALPGGLFEEPYIRDLATKLRACITEAGASGSLTPKTDPLEFVSLPPRSIATPERLCRVPAPAENLNTCQ